jgi:hypothetical protein
MQVNVVTRIIFTSLLLISIGAALPAYTQIEPLEDDIAGDLGIAQGQTTDDLLNFVTNIINAFLAFAALIAAIFFIVAGVRYITSQGDEQAAETAKKMMLYAFIGLLLIGFAAIIVNYIVVVVGWSGPS